MEERQTQGGATVTRDCGMVDIATKRQPAPCWGEAPDIQSPHTKGTPDTIPLTHAALSVADGVWITLDAGHYKFIASRPTRAKSSSL